MSSIHICGLSRLVETINASGARHVASLINAGMEVPYPLSVPYEQRLYLGFNDINEDVAGFIPPEKEHAEQLISFVQNWNRETPLVIHCWMGVSRSTAGGYISQCALMPDKDEYELALDLRAASPEATPNRRLIEFADDILERDGRMVSAISEIGRGAETFEGVPFALPIE